MSDLSYWLKDTATAYPLEEAIAYARVEMREHGEIYLDVEELRPATTADIPDCFSEVIDCLEGCVESSGELGIGENNFTLRSDEMSEQAEALKSAIAEYLRRNVDLSEAGLQPTGRVLRVTFGGYEILEAVEEPQMDGEG